MLKHRLYSGLLLACAFALAVGYLPPVGGWLVIAVISAMAQLEFYQLVNKAGIPVFRFVGVVCGTAMISATFLTIGPTSAHVAEGYRWENLVLLATMIFVFVRQFPQKHNDKPLATIAVTLFGVFYVPFLFNYVTRLAFTWRTPGIPGVGVTGCMMVFYLVAVVKLGDAGAFFVGRKLGRHKLFPRLSPKKTWEGFIGGVVTSVLASWLFYVLLEGHLGILALGLSDALIVGVLLSVVGIIGDMFESLVKRASGVKDSSAVIPGLGGLLDVLDSLLFGAPVLYVYVTMVMTS